MQNSENDNLTHNYVNNENNKNNENNQIIIPTNAILSSQILPNETLSNSTVPSQTLSNENSENFLEAYNNENKISNASSINAVLQSIEEENSSSKENLEDYSGVGVLDKIVRIIDTLEQGPLTLAQLVEVTHLPRPTAHRLVTALEHYNFASRNHQGKIQLGSRFTELASYTNDDLLLSKVDPVLKTLVNKTGESALVFRRQGGKCLCVAAENRNIASNMNSMHNERHMSYLQNQRLNYSYDNLNRESKKASLFEVGSVLPLTHGSIAQVLLAWENLEKVQQYIDNSNFTNAHLNNVRKRGYAESLNDYDSRFCSISAPIRNSSGKVIAALTISGEANRMGTNLGLRYSHLIISAGKYLSESLSK